MQDRGSSEAPSSSEPASGMGDLRQPDTQEARTNSLGPTCGAACDVDSKLAPPQVHASSEPERLVEGTAHAQQSGIRAAPVEPCERQGAPEEREPPRESSGRASQDGNASDSLRKPFEGVSMVARPPEQSYKAGHALEHELQLERPQEPHISPPNWEAASPNQLRAGSSTGQRGAGGLASQGAVPGDSEELGWRGPGSVKQEQQERVESQEDTGAQQAPLPRPAAPELPQGFKALAQVKEEPRSSTDGPPALGASPSSLHVDENAKVGAAGEAGATGGAVGGPDVEARLLAALAASRMELRTDPEEELTEYRLCRVLESGAFSPVAPDEMPAVEARIAAELRASDPPTSSGGAQGPLPMTDKDKLLLRLDMLDGWLHEIAQLELLASDPNSAYSPLASPAAAMLPIQPLDLAALGHPTPKRQRRVYTPRPDQSPRPGARGIPGNGVSPLSPGLQVPATGAAAGYVEAGASGGGVRPLLAKSPQVRHRVRRPGQAGDALWFQSPSDRESLATWGQRRSRVPRAHASPPGQAQGSAWQRASAELLQPAVQRGPHRSLAASGMPAPADGAASKSNRRARRPEVAVALGASSSPGPTVQPGVLGAGGTFPIGGTVQASGSAAGARVGDLSSRSHAGPDRTDRSSDSSAVQRDGAKRRRVVVLPGTLGGGSPLVSPKRQGSGVSESKPGPELQVKVADEQAQPSDTRSNNHAAQGESKGAPEKGASQSSPALGNLSPRTRAKARVLSSPRLASLASPSSGTLAAPALDAAHPQQVPSKDGAAAALGQGESGARAKGQSRALSLLPSSSAEAGAAGSPSALLKSRRHGSGKTSSPNDARRDVAEHRDSASALAGEGRQKRPSKEGAAAQARNAGGSIDAAPGHALAATGPGQDIVRSRAKPKAKRDIATGVPSPLPGGAATSIKPIQVEGAAATEPARIQGVAIAVPGGGVAGAGLGAGGSKRRRRPNRKYADSEFHDLEEFDDVAWAELEGAKLPLDEHDWKPLEAGDLGSGAGLAALDALGSAGGVPPAPSTAARTSDAARGQFQAKSAGKSSAGEGPRAAGSMPGRAPQLASPTRTLPGLVSSSGPPSGARAGSKQQGKQQGPSDEGRSGTATPVLNVTAGAAKAVAAVRVAGSESAVGAAAGVHGLVGGSASKRQVRASGQPKSVYGADWVTEGSDTDELLEELHSSPGDEGEEQPWGILSPQQPRRGTNAPVTGAQAEPGYGKGQKRKKPSALLVAAQDRAKQSRQAGVQLPTKSSKPLRPPGSSPTKSRPYAPVGAAASEERPIASLAAASSGPPHWQPEGVRGAPDEGAKKDPQLLSSPGSLGLGGAVGALGSGGSGEESDSGVGLGSRTSSGARILEELDGGDEAEGRQHEGEAGGEGEGGPSREDGQALWQARVAGTEPEQGTPKKRDPVKGGPGSPASSRSRRLPKDKQSEGESGGEGGSAGSGGPRGGGPEGGGEDSRIYTANGGIRRKHHRPWTLREVLTLVDGVAKCGGGKWADIKKLSFASMGYRTAVDLKDKWRNLLRASRLATQPGKEGETSARKKQMSAAIPAHVLQRVRELSQLQQQQQQGAQPHPPLQPLLAMHEQEQQRQHAEAQRFEQQAHVSPDGPNVQEQAALSLAQLRPARPELEQLQEQPQRHQWEPQEALGMLQAGSNDTPQFVAEHTGLGDQMQLEEHEQGQREDDELGPLDTPTIPSLASLAELDSTFGDEFDQLLPL